MQLHFIGSHNTSNRHHDYISQPVSVTIPKRTTQFLLNISINNDSILEDNEQVQIIAIPPKIPDGMIHNYTVLTIIDDDGM